MSFTSHDAAASTDWAHVAADLAPIACDTGERETRRKSRDYYWFSPLLKAEIDDWRADLIATPADLAELETLVAYCVAHRLPITVRGAGTGNYGQCMPRHGGVVVDLTRLDRVLSIGEGTFRAQGGIRMYDLEQELNRTGQELRFFPSTWRSATLGGFIAGGTTGCGAIGHGTLHTPGNVLALKILTAGDTPTLIELTGAEAQAAVHAYGTNGIIVEAELALAPLGRWHDRIYALPDLGAAMDLADRIGRDRTLAKKQLAVVDAAVIPLVRPLAETVPAGSALVLAMIGEDSLASADAAANELGGSVAFARAPGEKTGLVPAIYEMCWNHTTLHAIGRDKSISYLQCGFPADYRPVVLAVAAELGDEMPMHLEFATIDGELVCFGIPLLRFTSAERLAQIHAILRSHGCQVFNPHTYVLENGGMQVADPQQLAFRRTSDPHGLFNPGKMPGWDVPDAA
ncbi:FAD linked oxidase domain protein [Novosphingobium nitrogenifigens DSM 19370]|uniref:FAD linked oxidase domain protein n=1 Tax=Novosphingobium nitrogenifigens DSM 19370 TaxID=983920 RepID=F1ZB60_9SPHN|nr:FAD-binding oxidoreductase [Novosphingobium nitrogenifigens]EGD58073.1 FAD linked oxidase domain protein [Novosphingobium nitrogenifigens DSM 19370]